MTFWGGSGSADLAIFAIDLQDASKKLIFNTIFSGYYFLTVTWKRATFYKFESALTAFKVFYLLLGDFIVDFNPVFLPSESVWR
jgi:hypothetical protein